MIYRLRILPIILITTALISDVYAEEANFGKKIPSTEQVLDYLKSNSKDVDTSGDSVDTSKSKSRSLNFVTKDDNRTLKHKPITPSPKSSEKAISMEILFDYNSSQLTDAGKEQLRPIGSALATNDLQGKHYRIEGHTDIVGGDAYNIELSRRRAEAVKNFLVSEYGLPEDAMKIQGKGKKNLANSEDPTSEVNRRVRIVLLSD
ncbi:OmpA family protein [Methylomonas sp. AM2-LC]|uniref:OmpA family protein n=1 Tax=Methylomonas sp. AM2-LC TaxID=3153301 RepID=UPI003263F3F1